MNLERHNPGNTIFYYSYPVCTNNKIFDEITLLERIEFQCINKSSLSLQILEYVSEKGKYNPFKFERT